MVAPLYIPPAMHKGSSFSTFSPTLIFFPPFFFYNNTPNRCEVELPCSFDLYFLNDYGCQASLHVLTDHLILSSEKCIFQSFVQF